MKAEVIKLYSIFSLLKYNLLYIFTFSNVKICIFCKYIFLINIFLAFYYFYIININYTRYIRTHYRYNGYQCLICSFCSGDNLGLSKFAWIKISKTRD